jgi:hypothetical protein
MVKRFRKSKTRRFIPRDSIGATAWLAVATKSPRPSIQGTSVVADAESTAARTVPFGALHKYFRFIGAAGAVTATVLLGWGAASRVT